MGGGMRTRTASPYWAVIIGAALAGAALVPSGAQAAATPTPTAHPTITPAAHPAAAPAKSSPKRRRGAEQASDLASLVNPFIGTTNGGDDFPGADAPFGMVQWSPDTTSRPDGGGYSYGDSAITGFSLTHLSGPGCGAEGDIPVLPTVGTVDTSATDSFSHSNESAEAGYYSVNLANGVGVQLTATTRTGLADFTFPSSTAANLIFKLNGSQNGDSATSFTVVSDTEVKGSVTSGNFCGAGNSYTVYFDMQFSQPFATSGTDVAGTVRAGARRLSLKATQAQTKAATSAHPSANQPVYHGALPAGRKAMPLLTGPADAYLTFNTTSDQTLLAKVGLSYVSTANAAQNLAAEDPGFDFSSVETATQASWNALLSKIQITGGTAAQQTEFYTALYHSLLHPNVFSDVNGQYMGVDGTVHTVDPGHSAFYTNFSGWDIYRSQAQLEALIDPQAASDTAQSMVDDYAQDGMLPKWMEDNGETYIMVGDPADSILADYYAFGATDFDSSAALSDMVAEATNGNNIRPGNSYLNEPGFLPFNGSYGCCNYYGPASTTLEYDTADFSISALASALGDTADRKTFLDRAQDWRNVLNVDGGFDMPRNPNSTWVANFDVASNVNFVEADSWIYTGEVPFDLAGLAAAKGGNEAMAAYLGTVLRSFTGADGYAWVGDEPSIELPWEYDYVGEPYNTQETVREIQDQIWTDTPGGLADGNDDLGEMSSWFVWSALGMYPMTPGTSDLALGSPMFTQAVITLPSGSTLTINGDGAADDAPYVQSATWNGASWDNAYAPQSAITSGGTLTYTLGTTANTSWAAASSEAPPSYGGSDVVAPPEPQVGAITSGVSSNLCVDDQGSDTADGNPVQVFTCNSSDAQHWTISPDGSIRGLSDCLDVFGNATVNGTPIVLWGCNGGSGEQWTTGADGALVNPHSGKCLDDPQSSTTSGTQLQLYTCNKTDAQDWTLPAKPPSEVGTIGAGVSSSLCVGDQSGSTTNGNPIAVDACSSSTAESWTVEPDGTLRVLGDCLDVTQSGTANGTLVDLWACNSTGAQQWRIESNGTLVNPESGKCLADPGSSTTAGTQLQLNTCNATSAEDWKLPS
jgi:predicted alpha-1,2-mannosidase